MTALLAFRDTRQIGGPIAPSALVSRNFPVAAATTIFAGGMVATDSAGNAVPASASTALKIWGIGQTTEVNTVAAGFGTAGQKRIDVMPGVHSLTNGSGVDAITAAHVGRLCYASDDNVVNLTDGAGLRPPAGRIEGLDGTQVKVALGEGSLWDEAEDVLDPTSVVTLKTAVVRNILNGDVPDLAAYVVASDAARNDATLGVEGDLVLAVAQTTAAQNGLYRIGVVAAGLAPLTRVSPMPTGYVFVADEYEIKVRSGTVNAHSTWFNSAGGTVGTNTQGFVPESITQSVAFPVNTGLIVITNVPILSTTKTGLAATNIAEVTADLTVRYSRQPGTVVAGALGTASITLMAEIAAGGVNVDDDSTMLITITNR